MITKILIVEKNEAVALDLRERLKGLGYAVVGVSASSDKAVQNAKKLNPDLILMNISLRRGRDGIKTGELIQSSHDIPIVYMTEHSGQATIQRTGNTGPFGYIFIPFNEKQLFATLEVAILRSQLEKQIREGRRWLAGVLNSIDDGVIAVDDQGKIRFINPIAQKLTGWHQNDAVGKALSEVFVYVDETSNEQLEIGTINELENVKKPATSYEAMLISKNGNTVSVETNVSMLTSGKDTVEGVVLVFRDIRKRREAIKEIKRQAERAQTLAQSASILNTELDLKNMLAMICNLANYALKASATAVFLYDSHKDVYRNMAVASELEDLKPDAKNHLEIPRDVIESLVSSEDQIHIVNEPSKLPNLPYSELFRGEKIKTVIIAGIYRQQEPVGALVSIFLEAPDSLHRDDLELLKGLADQASISITNALLFEQVRIGREKERALAKSLVDIQETERRHIARELHDHLGQILTGLQFMLENAKNQANVSQKAILEEIQSTVSDVIGQVREMSLNLRPSMLDDMGLLPTLRWHIDRFTSQTGIRVNFQCDEFPERFPTEIETAAYRIIQEALTNVARHAQVKEVFVGLIVQEKTLWVEVLDQGKGFDLSAYLAQPTSGLGGMRERASLMGGYLVVESFINQGTQIAAALPLTGEPLERRKYDRNRPPGR